MTDEQIRQELRQLPRNPASEGFTERVLEQLDRVPAGSPNRPAPGGWLRVAAVLALLLVAPVWFFLAAKTERSNEAKILELLEEKARIEAELEVLREQSTGSALVYLGGNADTDLVLDLEALARRRNRAGKVDSEGVEALPWSSPATPVGYRR